MAGNDIVSAILHYKRNIDKISDPPNRALKYEDRLLHCINKLYKLPVRVSHLQETGVGRTVNALRKIEGEKGLGDAAKALVAKWKVMVMQEDEAERKQKKECSGPSDDDINRIKLIREAEKLQLGKTDDDSGSPLTQGSSDGKESKSESSDDCRSRKRKHEGGGEERNHFKRRELLMDGNNDDDDDDDDGMEGKKVLENGLEHTNVKLKSKSHSRSKSSDRSSSKSSSLEKVRKEDRKKKKERERKQENSLGKHHKSSQRHSEKHETKDKTKAKVYPENDGFDSQSGRRGGPLTRGSERPFACAATTVTVAGASFADALGSIVVKKSPKKKSSQNSATSSPAPSDHSADSVSVLKEKKDVKDLLFSQPKLVPLEPDLVATLPTPTPYYKPHPSYIPTQEAVRKRVQAEEDALTTIMSNKNTRTKVYSGVKGGLTYVPSLYEFCCRILQQHIDALEYTGGIPFSLLKPVLEGATPSQLYRFEHFNPYIIEDTDDLWKFHVSKEFRNEKRQEFESWRDMYLRCIDEREEKYKAVTANIIQRTIENSVPVRKAKLAYIDSPKPPRNILKKQIKNGIGKPDVSRLLGKNDPEAVKVSAPKQPTTREPAVFKVKPKVAPLMQKTLKSIKMSRFKR